jgi:hypothetical protein
MAAADSCASPIVPGASLRPNGDGLRPSMTSENLDMTDFMESIP